MLCAQQRCLHGGVVLAPTLFARPAGKGVGGQLGLLEVPLRCFCRHDATRRANGRLQTCDPRSPPRSFAAEEVAHLIEQSGGEAITIGANMGKVTARFLLCLAIPVFP